MVFMHLEMRRSACMNARSGSAKQEYIIIVVWYTGKSFGLGGMNWLQ
jgi:hypothetical protein